MPVCENDSLQTAKQEVYAWLQTQPQFHAAADDILITRYIYGCKFNVEKVKRKMKSMYEMRAKVPAWFEARDPAEPFLASIISQGPCVYVPKPDSDGIHLFLTRCTNFNPKTTPFEDILKVVLMVADSALVTYPGLSEHGVHIVADLQGASLSHIWQITPQFIYRAVTLLQECYPVKAKSIHFVNIPSYLSFVVNLMRLCLTEKIRKRLFVHKNMKDISKHIESSIVPLEYGGLWGPISELVSFWELKLNREKNWFLGKEKDNADLRPIPSY